MTDPNTEPPHTLGEYERRRQGLPLAKRREIDISRIAPMEVSQCPDEELREELALNRLLTDDQKRVLATDSNEHVRFTIAMKNSLPYDVLSLLARDEDVSVRQRIARHKKLPDDLRRKLLEDPAPEVRSEAASDRGE